MTRIELFYADEIQPLQDLVNDFCQTKEAAGASIVDIKIVGQEPEWLAVIIYQWFEST